jgi:uncharacterized protein YjbJ (UPF0337 family)
MLIEFSDDDFACENWFESDEGVTMNVTFNRDVLAGQWKQVRGKAKQTWGKLTDNDLDRITGRFDELAGLIQQRYGYTKDQAEKEVTHFIEKMNMK